MNARAASARQLDRKPADAARAARRASARRDRHDAARGSLAQLLDRLERLVALEAPDDAPERGGEPADVVVEREVFGSRSGRRLTPGVNDTPKQHFIERQLRRLTTCSPAGLLKGLSAAKTTDTHPCLNRPIRESPLPGTFVKESINEDSP